jgi:DNA-binding NtrC family response regulator
MSKLVFIVEDDLVQQKMLQHHFEEMLGNYTVKTFTDPDDLMNHINEKPFAIVLDHFYTHKKDKTGLDYLKELKKKRGNIPVVYYTSCTDEAVKTKATELGAEYFINKNSASLVRLRTALDSLNSRKKGFLQGLFKG